MRKKPATKPAKAPKKKPAKKKTARKAERVRVTTLDDLVGKHAKRPRAATPEPAPQQGGQGILGLVISDLVARSDFGREKYGTRLHTNNGRDALWDALQEAYDLCMYLRQAIAERDAA